jgi:uncharacterized membrane protein
MVIEIGTLLSTSWQAFSKNIVNNILVMLVGAIAASLVGALTLGILGIPIYAGMVKTYRKALHGGSADFGDLFSEFGNLGKWFMLWVLALVVGLASAITFGLGSIVAGFLLYFTLQLMLDKDMAAFDAAKESFGYVTGNFGAVFVPILVIMLVSAAGSILLYVGALVTVPWMLIGSWLLYEKAFGSVPAASNVPASME